MSYMMNICAQVSLKSFHWVQGYRVTYNTINGPTDGNKSMIISQPAKYTWPHYDLDIW